MVRDRLEDDHPVVSIVSLVWIGKKNTIHELYKRNYNGPTYNWKNNIELVYI